MNFRLSALFALIIGFVFSVSAQRIKVEKGPVSKSSIYDFIGHTSEGYFGSKTYINPNGIVTGHGIVKYDQSLAFAKELRMDLKLGNGQSLKFREIISVNDKVIVIAYHKQASEKKFKYYGFQVNQKSLELNEPILIATTPIVAEEKYVTNIIKSEHETLFMFSTNESGSGKHIISVVNSDLQQLWEKYIPLPYNEKLFTRDLIFLNDSADVFVAGKCFNLKMKEHSLDYTYMIFRYAKDTESKAALIMDTKNKIANINFLTLPNGKMAGLGVYTNDEVYTVKGTFFMIIDLVSGASGKQTLTEFKWDNYDDGLSNPINTKNSNVNKHPMSIYSYLVHQPKVLENGDIVLIANPYYYSGYYVDRSHNVILSFYKSNGESISIIEFPTSLSMSKSLYFLPLGSDGDKLYVMFQEDPRNTDPTKEYVPGKLVIWGIGTDKDIRKYEIVPIIAEATSMRGSIGVFKAGDMEVLVRADEESSLVQMAALKTQLIQLTITK